MAGLLLGFPAIVDIETFLGSHGIEKLLDYYPFSDNVPTPVDRMILNPFGFPLAVLASVGIVHALIRRERREVFLLVLFAMYGLFLVRNPSPYHRHYLYLVALGILFGARGVVILARSRLKFPAIAAGLLVAFGVLHAARITAIFASPDVRDETLSSIGAEMPQ